MVSLVGLFISYFKILKLFEFHYAAETTLRPGTLTSTFSHPASPKILMGVLTFQIPTAGVHGLLNKI